MAPKCHRRKNRLPHTDTGWKRRSHPRKLRKDRHEPRITKNRRNAWARMPGLFQPPHRRTRSVSTTCPNRRAITSLPRRGVLHSHDQHGLGGRRGSLPPGRSLPVPRKYQESDPKGTPCSPSQARPSPGTKGVVPLRPPTLRSECLWTRLPARHLGLRPVRPVERRATQRRSGAPATSI